MKKTAFRAMQSSIRFFFGRDSSIVNYYVDVVPRLRVWMEQGADRERQLSRTNEPKWRRAAVRKNELAFLAKCVIYSYAAGRRDVDYDETLMSHAAANVPKLRLYHVGHYRCLVEFAARWRLSSVSSLALKSLLKNFVINNLRELTIVI